MADVESSKGGGGGVRHQITQGLMVSKVSLCMRWGPLEQRSGTVPLPEQDPSGNCVEDRS